MNLSPDFTLAEMTRSSTATRLNIRNNPDKVQIQNLKRLCENLLQPLRDACGKPLCVSSGFRCSELNRAIKGSPTSDHLAGRAADILTDHPLAVFAWVCRLNLSFDQAIIYKNFIHLSYRDELSNRKTVIVKG